MNLLRQSKLRIPVADVATGNFFVSQSVKLDFVRFLFIMRPTKIIILTVKYYQF